MIENLEHQLSVSVPLSITTSIIQGVNMFADLFQRLKLLLWQGFLKEIKETIIR